MFKPLLFATGLLATTAHAVDPDPLAVTDDLLVTNARVDYRADLDLLVFELEVQGTAGATYPRAAGQMDGAPVLAYVFPTTLRPGQVGFAAATAGTLALVATSHPDFDDTPLWDENGNGANTDTGDGRVFHSHWVVLTPQPDLSGGLAVKAVETSAESVLPPTAPGMPIYLDSPGFSVVLRGNRLRIPVPAWRIRDLSAFNFDAVTAYLQVNTSDSSRPTLGVYQVYSVLSGNLSLPQRFTLEHEAY